MAKHQILPLGLEDGTQGDILLAGASGRFARLGIGSSLQVPTSNGTTLAYATPIFSKAYASTGQTISAAGALTLAHSLGAAPKAIFAYIKCTSGEHGYSVGDELFVNIGVNPTAGADRGMAVKRDATNILIKFTSTAEAFSIFDFSTGAIAGITNASWQLYVLAYA